MCGQISFHLVIKKQGNSIIHVDGERRLKAVLILIKRGVDIPWVMNKSQPSNASDYDRLIYRLEFNSGKPFNLIEKGQI